MRHRAKRATTHAFLTQMASTQFPETSGICYATPIGGWHSIPLLGDPSLELENSATASCRKPRRHSRTRTAYSTASDAGHRFRTDARDAKATRPPPCCTLSEISRLSAEACRTPIDHDVDTSHCRHRRDVCDGQIRLLGDAPSGAARSRPAGPRLHHPARLRPRFILLHRARPTTSSAGV